MRPDRHLKTALALTFVLGAIAAPAASADSAQTGWVVQPNPDQQTPASAPATIVRVSTPSSGFDWGDAGIGAAAGIALSMLALGLVLVVSQHHARRSRGPAAPAN